MSQNIPAVLVFSGLDPSGGAGIQADIEALASHGCHACPIVTTLTTQDTLDVKNTTAVDASLLYDQACTLLNDVDVAAIKIGLVDNAGVITAIHSILNTHADIPVILDPVLSSGADTSLNSDEVQSAIIEKLLPLTTILTPNSKEAYQLATGANTLDACARSMLDQGSEFVLITGAHEPTEDVCNALYNEQGLLEKFNWPRLQGEHHGSGCTLASSIAGLLAQGNEPLTAIHEAQEYTWQCLKQAYHVGKGQSIPNRFFWASNK